MKFYSVNPIKKLLCFISISILPFYLFATEDLSYEVDRSYLTYSVEKGDSLWSISRAYNVEISDLVRANKISYHNTSLPKIFVGEKLYIPVDINYSYPETYCLNSLTSFPIIFNNLKLRDYSTNCTEKINKQLQLSALEDLETDDIFWQKYLSDSRYPFYFYNLANLLIENICKLKECELTTLYDVPIERHYIPDKNLIGKNFDPESLSNVEEAYLSVINIIYQGVLKGDSVNRELMYNLHDTYEDFYLLKDIYLDGRTIEKYREELLDIYGNERDFLIWLYSWRAEKYANYLDYLEADTSILTAEEMAIYLEAMIEITYYANDKQHFKLKKQALDFISVNKKSFIDYYTSNLVVNLSFLNTLENKLYEVEKLYDVYLSNFGFENVFELWEATLRSTEKDYLVNDKLVTLVLMILNNYGLSDKLDGNGKLYVNEKMKFLKSLRGIYQDHPIMNELLAISLSEAGLNFSEMNECETGIILFEEAKQYFNKLSDDGYRYTTSDSYMHETIIEHAICFFEKGDLSRSRIYLDESIKYYKNIDLKSYSYESLYEILNNILNGEINIQELRKSTDRIFQNELPISFEYRSLLKTYISFYIEIYDSLDKESQSDLEHPIELLYLEERLNKIKDLQHVKTQKKEANVEFLLSRISSNGQQIARLESGFTKNEASDLDSLERLFQDRKNLYRELFNEQQNLKKLYNPDFKYLQNIINNLNEDETLLSFHLSNHKNFVILIQRDKELFIELEATQELLRAKTKNLIKSLEIQNGEIPEFDFDTAHEIYSIIFKDLSNVLNKNSTIYLFGSELENLPFYTLVSKNSQSENRLQKLLETKFLIDDYNFVNLFPLSSERITEYDFRFIGFANPSSLSSVGLSALPSTEEETRFIEMASGSRNGSFTGKKATIENVNKISQGSYERIHFGTHAVPPYWNNITSESSLVLNSSDGDFLLSASEISSLEIESDMVILSSCNSSSNGFDQLYKAFLVAGSNSVVFSNWDLETSSSKELNKQLFSLLWDDENLENHEALRLAMLKMKNSYNDTNFISPSYWANFSIAYSSL